MTEIWITTAVSVLPPGWVVVVEGYDGTLAPVPCPALLLQQDQGSDDPGLAAETRVVPACHWGEGEFVAPRAAGVNVYTVTTGEDWETMRPDAEREVAESRARIRERMLARITEAGAEGVPAADLIPDATRHAYVGVRQQLQQDGLVTTTWEPDDTALNGKVCIYHQAAEGER